eukprot:2383016-Pyramimonas_sp.AAC.1
MLMKTCLKVRAPGIDPPLRGNLYAVLLETLGDEQKWEEGMATVDTAFRYLPHKEHRKLWGMKVGLHAVVKPLLSRSATGEFKFPGNLKRKIPPNICGRFRRHGH